MNPPVLLNIFGKEKWLNDRRTVNIDLNVSSGFFATSRPNDARVTARIVGRINLIDFKKTTLLNIGCNVSSVCGEIRAKFSCFMSEASSCIIKELILTRRYLDGSFFPANVINGITRERTVHYEILASNGFNGTNCSNIGWSENVESR